MGNSSLKIYTQDIQFQDRDEFKKQTEKLKESKQTQEPSMRKSLKFMRSQIKMISQIEKKRQDDVKMINDYTIISNIGTGMFGKVKKVIRLEDGVEKSYAMKILKKVLMRKVITFHKSEGEEKAKPRDGQYFMNREIAVYKKIRHPNLIKLYEVLKNDIEKKVYLIMELAEKGQLIDWSDDEECWIFKDNQRKQPISEEQLKSIARGCIKGIDYLHQNGIVHMDIKPQNILFAADNTVKISDFGTSHMNIMIPVSAVSGTEEFFAPQVYDQDKMKMIDGRKLDIWALGVSLFCYWTMRHPFNENSLSSLIEAVVKNEPKFNEQSPKQLLDFIGGLLQKDPQKRMTLAEAIRHPWLKDESLGLQSIVQRIEVTNEEIEKSINNSIIKSRQTKKTQINMLVSQVLPFSGQISENISEIPKRSRNTKMTDIPLLNQLQTKHSQMLKIATNQKFRLRKFHEVKVSHENPRADKNSYADYMKQRIK